MAQSAGMPATFGAGMDARGRIGARSRRAALVLAALLGLMIVAPSAARASGNDAVAAADDDAQPTPEQVERTVSRLRAESPDFRRRWGEAHIARHRSSTKTATATPVGPIAIDCDVLTAPGTDLRIVVYTAVPGSADASKLELLGVAGTQALTF